MVASGRTSCSIRPGASSRVARSRAVACFRLLHCATPMLILKSVSATVTQDTMRIACLRTTVEHQSSRFHKCIQHMYIASSHLNKHPQNEHECSRSFNNTP